MVALDPLLEKVGVGDLDHDLCHLWQEEEASSACYNFVVAAEIPPEATPSPDADFFLDDGITNAVSTAACSFVCWTM